MVPFALLELLRHLGTGMIVSALVVVIAKRSKTTAAVRLCVRDKVQTELTQRLLVKRVV